MKRTNTPSSEPCFVINGDGLIVGRVATQVVKKLLAHKPIVITNAEKMLMTGNKSAIVEHYRARVNTKNLANPEHSPYWSRRPDLLVKRIIRGMLPWHSRRGRDAYKLLRVYLGDRKIDGVPLTFPKPGYVKKYISVGELCEELGWKH